MDSKHDSYRVEFDAFIVADAAVFSAALVPAAPLSLLLGPALAWYLHGGRFDKRVVVCGLLGLLCAFAAAAGVFGVLLAAGALRSGDTPSDFIGGIVVLAVTGMVFLATLVVLDVDAIRDLAASRRLHPGLDIARVAASVLVVGGSIAVAVAQSLDPGSEIGDAGPFAIASGLVGGVTMLFGRAILAYWSRRGSASGTHEAEAPPE